MKLRSVFWAADDGGGGAPPDGEKKSGGGGGGGDDVAGLKSALEKERTNAKELRRQLTEVQGSLAKLQADAGSVEDLKKKLGEASEKLTAYEKREARISALAKAAEAATKEGLVVDVENARRYIERVAGDDADALAKEAVELFGTKAPEKKDEKKTDAGSGRAFGGQPTDDKKGAAPDQPRDLGRLYKEDRARYDAIMAEQRKGIPFFGGNV